MNPRHGVTVAWLLLTAAAGTAYGQAPDGAALYRTRIADGSVVWHATPLPCGSRPQCSPAQSAAVSVIEGVVFSGALDGHLRAYAAATGAVLWDFDTVREYDTVNRVQARGGAIDGPGAVVANGLVLVNSGYTRFGGIPGNVLIAFAPRGQAAGRGSGRD
jgi:polyvinyl alcohol dehydrogenase (cytochrome)